MSSSICGADCANCLSSAGCGGCRETGGRPFHGGECILSACCRARGQAHCAQCGGACGLKTPLIEAFNALGIPDMPEVTDLNALPGAYINLAYTLPNGQTVRLLEDEKICLGNQVEKRGSGRCYGLAAVRPSCWFANTGRMAPIRRSFCIRSAEFQRILA